PDWLLADMAPQPGARSRLQELLTSRLNLAELQILVANVHEQSPGLNYDNLQGGLDTRVNDLLGFLVQRKQLLVLVRELYASRPDMRPDLIRLWSSPEA